MMNRRSFLGGLAAAVAAVLLPKARTVEAREASADKGGFPIPDDLLDDVREMLDAGASRYREVFLPLPDEGDAAETLTRLAREAGVDPSQTDADDKAMDALRRALNGMRSKATTGPLDLSAFPGCGIKMEIRHDGCKAADPVSYNDQVPAFSEWPHSDDEASDWLIFDKQPVTLWGDDRVVILADVPEQDQVWHVVLYGTSEADETDIYALAADGETVIVHRSPCTFQLEDELWVSIGHEGGMRLCGTQQPACIEPDGTTVKEEQRSMTPKRYDDIAREIEQLGAGVISRVGFAEWAFHPEHLRMFFWMGGEHHYVDFPTKWLETSPNPAAFALSLWPWRPQPRDYKSDSPFIKGEA